MQTAVEQQNHALLDVLRPDLLTIMTEEIAKAKGETAATMLEIQTQLAGFRLSDSDKNAAEAVLQQLTRFRDFMAGKTGK
jgi:hypothetical protein